MPISEIKKVSKKDIVYSLKNIVLKYIGFATNLIENNLPSCGHGNHARMRQRF